MRKLSLVLTLLFCTAPLLIFAGGRKDNESHEVESLEGFTESVNVETKKTGKWNIYVEAQDKGGNTYRAGPHNIYIDPVSDLPIARIINPQVNMHVQGNLNIVGTCMDDDGVSHVELVITRGSDGKGEVMLETRAQGTEFWSYLLDTSDTQKWRDGVYTISAWGTDIHGLSGISSTFPAKVHKKHSITWNLDRKKPEIAVTSHDLGALVNGKVSIKGTVWDGNGVETMSYSVDGGNRYLPAKLKYDKKNDKYSFDISLDTRTIEDGPAVISFKATDKMKSEGALSHLIFANNTGPDVQILYPEEKEAVNGIFTVAGYAMHKIGLSSLSYKLGKNSGEIPLVIGNPWWVHEFDIRGENTKSMDLEIRAVDLSGNVTVAKRKLIVDQDADKPKVTLNEPAAGAIINGFGLPLVGLAEDDDGVASIFYAIGTNPPVEVPCSGYFQLVAENIPPGIHNLDIWAKDITGVVGPKVSVKGIAAPGAEPAPKFTKVLSGSGKTAAVQAFYSGIDVNALAGSTLELTVSSGSALQNLSYQFGSRAAVAVAAKGTKGGDFTQSIPVPKDLEPGQLRMEIIAKDIYNRETVYEDYIHVLDSSGQRPYASDTFTWVRPRRIAGNTILLSTIDPIVGIYNGKPLRSVEVAGTNVSSFIVDKDENGLVNLLGAIDGEFKDLRLTLTTVDGKTFTTPEYRIIVDSGNPELEIVSNTEGKWVQNEVLLGFKMSDGNKIKAVDFSVNMGSNWRSLIAPGDIENYSANTLIERTLDITALPDGAVVVNIRVTDEAGNETIKFITVNKDTKKPEPQLIVPISGARVNGTIRLGIAIKENGKLSTIVYNRPETAAENGVLPAITKQVYSGGGELPLTFLDILLDSTMPLDKAMNFTFRDEAGNTSALSSWPFVIDNEMDLPVTQISLPMENETISTDFVVSGVCFDDDKIKQIYWKVDSGNERIIEAENGFSIPIPLSSMTDNEHTVTVYAEDIYGVKGKPVTRNFRVSLKEPVASVVYPTPEEIIGGMVSIKGTAFDENGIKQIMISLDNGNTYNDAGGTAEWVYTFNSKIIQDGNHAVFIKVIDKYDISAMYSFLVNIDNTPPELTLYTPSDGAETTGPLYFTGQVMDAMRLESVTIKLNSLEGVKIPEKLANKSAKLDSILLEDMDISSLPDGNYNIEVWATDKAQNTSRTARNIKLAKEGQRNFVDVLYPLSGQHMSGNFDIYGHVGGIDTASQVTLVLGGIDAMTEEVTEAGYYRFNITPEILNSGNISFVVRGNFSNNEMVQSQPRNLNYSPVGPWVSIDTMSMGDFAYERPWLFGRAGYILSGEDRAILEDKKADKEKKADVEAKKPEIIELSLNNGRTFFEASKARTKGFDWRYRLETQDMAEGLHYLIVRATMLNGETAVTRLLIQVDKTAPMIRLISPEAGGHYNNELNYAALASDDVELKSLTYHLRRGDKNRYEIPGFIKGLYFDVTIPPFIKQVWNTAPGIFAGGATYMDMGFGLSFFDDNVKIQVQYGLMTQKLYDSLGATEQVRYGGHVLGFKILANVYTLPFGAFGGPDWDWLSASFALGANFSLFNVGNLENPNYTKPGDPVYYTQSGKPTWMTALLLQIEFPRITIPKRKYLRTFSIYTEGQLWFVPTDVNAIANNLKTVIPHVIVGLRMYVF